MAPRILLIGLLKWGQQDCEELLGPIAQVEELQSKDRAEFLKDVAPGGRYDDIAGMYSGGPSAAGPLNKEFFDALPSTCKWIAHKGAGYDNVDVHAAKAKGITVSNTPGAVDEGTATTGVYLLISSLRQFSMCETSVRQGGWVPKQVEGNARDLSGKTIGIVGMGGIGLTFVNYIRPFGMNIIYHNRRPNKDAPEDVKYVDDLYNLLEQVDVLYVSLPLNAKTRGFIGEKEIRAMRKGSIIVNTARGAVIDEEAMIKALQDGHLASVGLDVYTNEPSVDPRLIEMSNVTLLPHVGTENRDARRKMEVVALTNLRDYLTKGSGPTPVPECL